MLPAAASADARKDRRPLPAQAQFLLAAMVVTTAALFAVALVLDGPSRWFSFALLLGFVVAADRLELYTGRFYDMRIATMPMVAAALLLPAPFAILCGVGFVVHRWDSGLLVRQRVFNGCNHALGGVAAWGFVQLIAPDAAERGGVHLAIGGIAATGVYVFCTWGLLVAILHLTRDLAFAELRHQLPAMLAAEMGLGALGIAVAGLWCADPVLVPFAILPLVLIWTSLKVSELRLEANVDAKTGLFNARHLREALASEVDRAARYERPISLLVLDLDFLRDVNNTYGHLAGDVVLAGIGDVLREELRSTDIPARFGGEEFVVVLPETPLERAEQLAERIRGAVADRPFDCGRGIGAINVTVSIGVASFPSDADTDEELLDAADAAVYDAKARGRNRVAVAPRRAAALVVV